MVILNRDINSPPYLAGHWHFVSAFPPTGMFPRMLQNELLRCAGWSVDYTVKDPGECAS